MGITPRPMCSTQHLRLTNSEGSRIDYGCLDWVFREGFDMVALVKAFVSQLENDKQQRTQYQRIQKAVSTLAFEHYMFDVNEHGKQFNDTELIREKEDLMNKVLKAYGIQRSEYRIKFVRQCPPRLGSGDEPINVTKDFATIGIRIDNPARK